MKAPRHKARLFIELRAASAATQAISGELRTLLDEILPGIPDGAALYEQLRQSGLHPRWYSPASIRIEDPVAGPLLVCFELLTLTIH